MPVIGLLRACHPGPTAAVTGFAAVWATVAVGLPAGRAALVTAAVLLGQLSIGWSNDAADAARDLATGRADKPVARGEVTARALWAAASTAAIGCVVASLALGLLPGVVHLVGVAAGWAYNLGLKSTIISPVPYAVAFALLPAVATTAADPPTWPSAGVLVAAAALGCAAHFADTVADADADAATGVRGLPQRIGPRASMVVMAGLVLVAAAALVAGPWRPGTAGTALLVAGAGVAGAAVALRGRWAFPVTLLAVGLVVVGFLGSG
ncbi:MAG: UbiA family prenyltransferase [Kineosporiaceae bacterium]